VAQEVNLMLGQAGGASPLPGRAFEPVLVGFDEVTAFPEEIP
jgi:hypothetical protein